MKNIKSNTPNKSSEYDLDKDLDIIFNLELIKDGARDAFLLESADIYNRDKIEHSDLLKIIKKKYPELKHTTETVVNGKPYLTFIHLKKLSPIRKGEDEDMWIGRILGFECLGIPSKDVLTYTVKAHVNDQNTYAEICPTKSLANKSRKKKYKLFKKTADRLNLELKITIMPWIPFKMYINAVLRDHKWLIKHKDTFFDALDNYGFSSQDLEDITIENLLKNHYDWLLFTTLRRHFDSYARLPLFTSTDQNKLKNIENKNFKDIIKKRISPIDGFKKVEKLFVNDLLLKDNDNYNTIWYSKKRDSLFDTYEYLYNKFHIKKDKSADYWDIFIKHDTI